MKQFCISFCASLAAMAVGFLALVALANYVPQGSVVQPASIHSSARSV